MVDLRWTQLRHQMLHACSVGRVKTTPLDREWNIKSGASTYVQMVRALNSLKQAGLVSLEDEELVPTKAGYTELYAWDGRHGQVARQPNRDRRRRGA